MKTKSLFEVCVGVIGLFLWAMHVLYNIHIFWVVLPMVLIGVCAIPIWFYRKKFAIPEGFESAFKKNNVYSLIASIFVAVIVYIAIKPAQSASDWDLWFYFVCYAFLFNHGAGLFVAYNKFLKKK